MSEPRTDYERDIVRYVESDGCFVTSVIPDERANSRPFSYSIGFTKSLSQPEVILVGLANESAHPLINDLFGLCKRGLKLSEGKRIDDLLRGYSCIARAVDESWLTQSYFASALWFHRTQMGSSLQFMVQIVWPDADGVFPWEADCAAWVCADQFAMYEPRIPA